MLKGVDALLNGDLLKILDEMGHGDQLLVVDRNYPASSAGRPSSASVTAGSTGPSGRS